MGRKVYVGNLNYQTTEDTLRMAFAEFGEVESVSIITDRYTGRSRGFAFVEMATDGAAEEAIAALNGRPLDDRELKVAEAKPQRERSSDRGRPRW